jgi:hypothetical protein
MPRRARQAHPLGVLLSYDGPSGLVLRLRARAIKAVAKSAATSSSWQLLATRLDVEPGRLRQWRREHHELAGLTIRPGVAAKR